MYEKHPAAERNQGFPQLAVWQHSPLTTHQPSDHPATHAGRAETRGWGLTTGMQKESIRHHGLQSAGVLHWKLGAGIVDWEPNASLRGVLEPTKTVVPKESISCTPVVANKPLSTRPNL